MPVDGAQGCIGAFMKLKQELHPHLRILLSVGGASGSAPFASITADDSKLHAFCTSIRDMLQKHSFDGVDSKQRTLLFSNTWAPSANHLLMKLIGNTRQIIGKAPCFQS
jgi:hypothetical protein